MTAIRSRPGVTAGSRAAEEVVQFVTSCVDPFLTRPDRAMTAGVPPPGFTGTVRAAAASCLRNSLEMLPTRGDLAFDMSMA